MSINSVKSTISSIALAGLVLLTTSEANAMSGIFGSKVLFSGVSGTVLLNGQPCQGARIEQSVADGGGERINAETTTNKNGQFKLPEISKGKGLSSLLPGEFVASQELIIHYDGKEYQGWISTKRSMETNAETAGKPFELICELDKEPDYGETNYGVCRLA